MRASQLIAHGARLLPTRKFATTRAVYSYTGLASHGDTLNGLVADNVAYTLSYYARLARLHRSNYRRRLYAGLDCRGTETLRTAATERRGVILASVHLGDFDLAGAWLAELVGLVPVVPAAAVPSRVRQGFFDRARRSCGVILRRQAVVSLGDLALDLDRGRLVLVMLDRRSGGRSMRVRFLGREALIPTTPWELGRSTGALVLPGATWRRHDGVSVLWCGRPASAGEMDGNTDMCAQRFADELTQAVRRAPHQWHVPANAAEMSWRPVDRAERAVFR